MTCYKQIQLTNTAIASVASEEYIPYGTVTRRINAPMDCCNTFAVSSSNIDTVTLNEVGFYKITYSLTGVAAAEGLMTIALIVNGVSVMAVSATAAADATMNLTLPYTVRVYPNCSTATAKVPVTVQIQNTGVELTSGSSNLIIEKV